jgi:hypothetical protein
MKTKKWYQSKEIWAGITSLVGGLSLYFTGEQGLEELILSVVGIIFMLLRTVGYTGKKLTK